MKIERPEATSDRFKQDDFLDGARSFYIKDLIQDEIDFKSGNGPELVYVVIFHNEEKTWIPNKTSLGRLIDMLGDDSDQWQGKLITLQREAMGRSYNGNSHFLTVRPEQPMAAAPPPPPPVAPAVPSSAVPPPPPPAS